MPDDLSDFRGEIQQALRAAAQDEAARRRIAERMLGFILRGDRPAGDGASSGAADGHEPAIGRDTRRPERDGYPAQA